MSRRRPAVAVLLHDHDQERDSRVGAGRQDVSGKRIPCPGARQKWNYCNEQTVDRPLMTRSLCSGVMPVKVNDRQLQSAESAGGAFPLKAQLATGELTLRLRARDADLNSICRLIHLDNSVDGGQYKKYGSYLVLFGFNPQFIKLPRCSTYSTFLEGVCFPVVDADRHKCC